MVVREPRNGPKDVKLHINVLSTTKCVNVSQFGLWALGTESPFPGARSLEMFRAKHRLVTSRPKTPFVEKLYIYYLLLLKHGSAVSLDTFCKIIKIVSLMPVFPKRNTTHKCNTNVQELSLLASNLITCSF